jgi:hypothetical protein
MLRGATSIVRRALCTLAIAALLALPSGARADETEVDPADTSGDIGFKIFDATIMRPSSALSIVVGAVFLVPASIMALPTGRSGVREAYDVFLGYPVDYTFRRPLGQE